jgi:hypothetical protein
MGRSGEPFFLTSGEGCEGMDVEVTLRRLVRILAVAITLRSSNHIFLKFNGGTNV